MAMSVLPIAVKLQEYLEERKIPYELIPHGEAYTAQETAHAEHVSGKDFAKVVMLRSGKGDVMAVIPANQKLNEEKLKELLHDPSARLAREHEFLERFYGCEMGAMPPFGLLYGIPMYVDKNLACRRDVIFKAGTHHASIKMKTRDYLSLTRAPVGVLTDEPTEAGRKENASMPHVDVPEQDRHFREK